jgi:hypothetical protein
LNGKEENLFDNLVFGKALNTGFNIISPDYHEIGNEILLVKLLTSKDKFDLWNDSAKSVNKELKEKRKKSILKEKDFLTHLLDGDNAKLYAGVNEYNGIQYYNKEKFENLLKWIFSLKILNRVNDKNKETKIVKGKGIKPKRISKVSDSETIIKNILKDYKFFNKIKKASDNSGYKLNELLLSFEKAKAERKVKSSPKDVSQKPKKRIIKRSSAKKSSKNKKGD